MINPEKIKQNLNFMTTAVNGLVTTENEAEKDAWATIYNSRLQAILAELDKDAIIEPTEYVAEPEATDVAPAEDLPPVPTPVEEEAKDESVQDTVADFTE